MKSVKYLAGIFGQEKLYFEMWWKYKCPFTLKTNWNDENTAFFIHIPKTAGTSLYTSLGMEKLSYTHIPARVLESFYPDEFENYFKFAVVRNPWDRFVSLYEFLKTGTHWPEQKIWAEKIIGNKTFEEFVRKINDDYWFRNAVMSDNFFFPQSYFVTDRKGRVKVDKIYKFEKLSSAFEDLNNRFSTKQTLSHQRKTSARKKYQDYYTEETKGIIASIYQSDVELFGYKY